MSIIDKLSKIVTPAVLADAGVPSASIAVLNADATITSHVFTQGTESPATLYQACSISKTFAALLLARLIDQGKLAYTDRVIDYLPKSVSNIIENPGTAGFLGHVTVGHLISHRSGLSQGGFPGCPTPPIPTRLQVLAGEAPARTPRIRFNAFPGSHFSYSGGGFTLLEVYLEARYGSSFVSLVENEVIKPLGLHRTRYGDVWADGERDYAPAYWTTGAIGEPANQRGYWLFSENAAAGVWTTAEDLMRVVNAVQRSLQGHDGAFLTKKTAEAMLVHVEPDSTLDMSMGWGSTEEWFGHSGSNEPGYRCWMMGARTTADSMGMRGIAVLTNSGQGMAAFQKIVAAALYLAGIPVAGKLPCGFGPWDNFIPYASPEHTTDATDYSKWLGTWEKGWELALDDAGVLRVSFGPASSKLTSRLLPAAIPRVTKHEEHVFVIEGLESALRLVETDGKKSLRITQMDIMGDILVIEKQVLNSM